MPLGPPLVATDGFASFVTSEMTRDDGRVERMKDLASQVANGGHFNLFSPLEESVCAVEVVLRADIV